MKKTINITIEAQFGSEFQEEFAVSSLEGVLHAWVLYLENSHKKNKIKIMCEYEPKLKDLVDVFGGDMAAFLKQPSINVEDK